MKTNVNPNYALILFLASLLFGCTANHKKLNETEVLNTMQNLSATTESNGLGPDAYATFLADDFSRWTIGSDVINNKSTWIKGIREWYDEGWRVSDRKQHIIEIVVLNESALCRRIVQETYQGPQGETSTSKAALAEIWVVRNNQWKLLQVNVLPLDHE